MSEFALPRWAVIVVVVIVFFTLMAFALALVGGYIADEYMTPALSEQSVPPARTY